MEIVLLKRGKEERLVLANGTAGGEPENVVAEDGLGNFHEPVEIGNRVKPLRLVAPQQSAVETVGSRFRYYVENAAAGAPKFRPEVTGLNRNLRHRIGDREDLFFAAQPDLVVFGSIQHVVVAARALSVDGKPSSIDHASRRAAPNAATRGFRRAGQGTSQREGIQGV
jgi:hypothetical protein